MKSPMTKERLAELRSYDANYTDEEIAGLGEGCIKHRRELLTTLDVAIAEIERLRDAYDLLAMHVGRLDFDRSESATPETQEQWIEFIRELDDRAQKLIENEEIGRDAEAGESR